MIDTNTTTRITMERATAPSFDFADLFAGWGGFSCGAVAAGGRLTWAANHNPVCVEAHAHTHPDATHECQDLMQADFSALPDVDVLLAAPACQGHSQASQPKRRIFHDKLRSTAWAVVTAAEFKRPDVVIVENVPDFLRWGLFPHWAGALESLGYALAPVRMVASDYGVPQDRDRLFVVATRSTAPIDLDLDAYRAEHAGLGSVIDWDAGRWRPVQKAGARVQERIAAGYARLGTGRFLTQHVTGHRGRSLTQAFPTITKQDQLAMVRGGVYRPLTIRETARGMGFPDTWEPLPGLRRRDVIEGLGNAVCPPVATALVSAVLAQA